MSSEKGKFIKKKNIWQGQGMNEISGCFNKVQSQKLSGESCSMTHAMWHNLCKVKPHKTTLYIFYELKHVYVKEKFKNMPGRVQSDYLFGGEVVGLRVRINAVLIYMECFDFFKEVSCLCGLPWWLSGKKKKKFACQGMRCGFNPWVGKIPWRRK